MVQETENLEILSPGLPMFLKKNIYALEEATYVCMSFVIVLLALDLLSLVLSPR